MKAKPIKIIDGNQIQCEPAEAEYIQIRMESPMSFRQIPVMVRGQRHGTNCWSWNGDTEKPTLKPSILTKGYKGNEVNCICHSFVTDGIVEFLTDSTHENAGKRLYLLDVD